MVPGEVEFTLDIRHTDEWKMDAFTAEIANEVRRNREAKRTENRYVIENLMQGQWLWMQGFRQRLRRPVIHHGFRSVRLPSGAGHDAQLFGPICPSAMIFVPSRAGISHSPDEFTEPDDLIARIPNTGSCVIPIWLWGENVMKTYKDLSPSLRTIMTPGPVRSTRGCFVRCLTRFWDSSIRNSRN